MILLSEAKIRATLVHPSSRETGVKGATVISMNGDV